jgi:hypothetical protein
MDVTTLLSLVVFAAFIVAVQIHAAPDLHGVREFYLLVPLVATLFSLTMPSKDARGLRGRS